MLFMQNGGTLGRFSSAADRCSRVAAKARPACTPARARNSNAMLAADLYEELQTIDTYLSQDSPDPEVVQHMIKQQLDTLAAHQQEAALDPDVQLELWLRHRRSAQLGERHAEFRLMNANVKLLQLHHKLNMPGLLD